MSQKRKSSPSPFPKKLALTGLEITTGHTKGTPPIVLYPGLGPLSVQKRGQTQPVQAGLWPPVHSSPCDSVLTPGNQLPPLAGAQEQGGSSCTISGTRLRSNPKGLQIRRLPVLLGGTRLPVLCLLRCSKEFSSTVSFQFHDYPERRETSLIIHLQGEVCIIPLSQMEVWKSRNSPPLPKVS